MITLGDWVHNTVTDRYGMAVSRSGPSIINVEVVGDDGSLYEIPTLQENLETVTDTVASAQGLTGKGKFGISLAVVEAAEAKPKKKKPPKGGK